jgi:hypothetical protein
VVKEIAVEQEEFRMAEFIRLIMNWIFWYLVVFGGIALVCFLVIKTGNKFLIYLVCFGIPAVIIYWVVKGGGDPPDGGRDGGNFT